VLAEANRELQLSDAMSLAVYVGRIEADCGLEGLIEAWTLIARSRPNSRLWLVGHGSSREALRRQIEGLNLGDRVVIAGVFDQVDEVLAAADFMLRPTFEAGTSLGLLEGLATGLPVVASDIPGHREWITDGADGLLAPPNDKSAWMAAIDRLLDEPELAARLSLAAQQKAACFSLATMADAHLTLFQELCELSPRPLGEG
jgi:glycosyltransferase involved in cell wall biosynthesis